MQGSFSDDALDVFNKLVSELRGSDFSESESSYDFTRCVRPDGTAYGTGGKCKKGTEKAKPEQATSPVKRTKAERDMAAKATLQRMAAKGPETSVRKQGDRVVVSKGSEFKAVLHPEHQTALGKLKEGEKHEFEDEQGTWWKATRSGDNLNLEGGDRRSGNKPYKLNVKRSEITSVDPNKSLMGQASHPSSFGRKVSGDRLKEMSDADLEIRKEYLKNASGYIGYKSDVDSVGQEIQRRVDEKVHEKTRPILTDVGTKKNPFKVKSSVSSQGGSYYVPGYSSSDSSVAHKGEHYTYTGKSGTNIKTGEPSKEFQTDGERRVYVSNSGKLYED